MAPHSKSTSTFQQRSPKQQRIPIKRQIITHPNKEPKQLSKKKHEVISKKHAIEHIGLLYLDTQARGASLKQHPHLSPTSKELSMEAFTP